MKKTAGQPSGAPLRCPVCGLALESPQARCPRCRTALNPTTCGSCRGCGSNCR